MVHAVDDIYAIELQVGATKIILNDAKGNQTQDINIEGKWKIYEVDGWYNYYIT